MVPIVYSPIYNITGFGLERLHPFDGRKYRRIHDWLISQGLRRKRDFVAPRPSTARDLATSHARPYLRSLRGRSTLARILEVPAVAWLPAWLTDWRVLRPMRWATGGTVLACRLALERGLAVNLGGGYHHASGNQGGGFCVYADVPMALAALKVEGRIDTALVVDTDAHQGNGTAEAIRPWGWAHLLDFYEEDIYPWPKVREEMAVPLPAQTKGPEYLEALRRHLRPALDRVRPDLVVYNAGSDVLLTDPLARLLLTPDEMAERDLYVATEARDRGVPVAMVLSGGYGPASWQAHARAIEGILARFDQQG
ncbi:MAG TPA: histone deacetylase [Gemmataceae bacterium]|jgi:histone deacetylase 11|nr:histone deacetylase [Gemmataceae bacterium]